MAGSSYRVVRGGGWGIVARFCRSAYRSRGSPEVRDGNMGFRPIRRTHGTS